MRKHYFYTLLIFSFLFFWGCTENDDNTILFVGDQGIPDINTYMPMELLESFGNEHLNFGDYPPDIQGTYKADKLSQVSGPSLGNLQPWQYYHRFTQQHCAEANYLFRTNYTQPYEVESIYIMGSDPYFTAYFYATLDMIGLPKHAVIISGEVTDSGIKDYFYGYYVVSYGEEPPSTISLPDTGTIYLFKENDHLAERSEMPADKESSDAIERMLHNIEQQNSETDYR